METRRRTAPRASPRTGWARPARRGGRSLSQRARTGRGPYVSDVRPKKLARHWHWPPPRFSSASLRAFSTWVLSGKWQGLTGARPAPAPCCAMLNVQRATCAVRRWTASAGARPLAGRRGRTRTGLINDYCTKAPPRSSRCGRRSRHNALSPHRAISPAPMPITTPPARHSVAPRPHRYVHRCTQLLCDSLCVEVDSRRGGEGRRRRASYADARAMTARARSGTGSLGQPPPAGQASLHAHSPRRSPLGRRAQPRPCVFHADLRTHGPARAILHGRAARRHRASPHIQYSVSVASPGAAGVPSRTAQSRTTARAKPRI